MPKEENSIKFQPITQGLGFHPFSDGLPYAPVSKTPAKPAQKAKAPPLDARTTPPPLVRTTPRGTGAVAAGPATFAFPKQDQASVKREAFVSVKREAFASNARKETKTAQAQPQSKPAFPEPALGALYMCKRVLAFALDTLLNTVMLGIGLGLSLLHQGIEPDLLVNPGVIFVAMLFFALFNWAVITAQEIAFGTSIGKRVFGLALPGSAGAILFRAFLFIPSFGFCGAGLLWSLIDSKRRCWHDLAAQIQPNEIARL